MRQFWSATSRTKVAARKHGNGTLTARQLNIGPATVVRELKLYADGHWALLFLLELARLPGSRVQSD
jgi:hypothetical protein